MDKKLMLAGFLILSLAGLLVANRTYSPRKEEAGQLAPQTVPMTTRGTAQVKGADEETAEAPVVDAQWLLEPGRSAGRITAATTLAELEKIYGKSNVKVTDIDATEGQTVPGAILFGQDPERRIEIIWKNAPERDTPGHTASTGDASSLKPESVRISGDKSLWHTAENVTLGTSLSDLETLNGRPFTLSGFGWDYGGAVLTWGDQGKLRPRFQQNAGLMVRLNPPPENLSGKLLEQISGDRAFASNTPAMRKLNPRVDQIIVTLNP